MCFCDCFNLKKLILPTGIRKIEAHAFGECQYSNTTIDEIYFQSLIPPSFDMECANGSKLFVPVESKDEYERASNLKHNVFSVLSAPDGIKYQGDVLSWNYVSGASSYEIDEDDIPIHITTDTKYKYRPGEGLHTLKIRSLGSFNNRVLSSDFSKGIVCGITPESEFVLNENRTKVEMYYGVNKTVVLPESITDITGSVLIFYNVNALYVPKNVKNIEYYTVSGIKELHIDTHNPYYYTDNGKIFRTESNEFFRDSILGDTYEIEGRKYYTDTHTIVE